MRIGTEDWSARPADAAGAAEIAVGTTVDIVGVEGVTALVRPAADA